MIKGAIEITEIEAKNAFRHGDTISCRIADAKAAKSSDGFYDQIREIIRDADVWDVGGAAGIDFFRSGKISKTWTVLELSNTWYKYWSAMAEPGLRFKECPDDFAEMERGKKQVLYTAGAIQYFECPVNFISTNSRYCDYIIFKDLTYGNKKFKSCQPMVGMVWIFSVDEIINALSDFTLIQQPSENKPYCHGPAILPEGFVAYAPDNFIFKRK